MHSKYVYIRLQKNVLHLKINLRSDYINIIIFRFLFFHNYQKQEEYNCLFCILKIYNMKDTLCAYLKRQKIKKYIFLRHTYKFHTIIILYKILTSNLANIYLYMHACAICPSFLFFLFHRFI